VLQWHGVGQDLIADAEAGDRRPDGADHSGGFHAQRHRRHAAHVPAASSNDVLPIADARGVNPYEELLGVRDLGRWQLQELDRASVCQYACASHVLHLLSGIGPSSPGVRLSLASHYPGEQLWRLLASVHLTPGE
jgi:hypothetical protein